MATADVPIDSGLIEIDGNAIQQRETLSRCFSEARRRLDQRERQLSLLLEQKLRENQIYKKKLDTDQLQLELTCEQVKASLSSNSLQKTRKEAVRLFEQNIQKLKEEEKRVQFEWSPQHLYNEINKIGDFSLFPAFTQDDILNYIGSQQLEIDVSPPSYEEQEQEIRSLLSQVLEEQEQEIHL